MKEILYIQAGNNANYVGTHFWNTQESYLASEDPEHALVDATISFRNESEDATLCPRLLIFDWKDNFGTLARDNALGTENVDDGADTGLWGGAIQSIRQPPIERSMYQRFLAKNDGILPGEQLPPSLDLLQGKPINQPSEWDGPMDSWGLGQDIFKRYNEEGDLMEGSVRLFLEESDALQGLQVTNDSGTFGGFTASFLTTFQDDYRKTPALVFPLLSGVSQAANVLDGHATRKTIGDALLLRALEDSASLTVPIQPPALWSPGTWRRYSEPDKLNVYHTSAILSQYIESASLPCRLTKGLDDIASLAAKLQVAARSPFAELSGSFPLSNISSDALSDIGSFSIPHYLKDSHSASTACRMDVTRGFSDEDVKAYESHLSAHLDSVQYISRNHALAYPIPTSFPSFLLPDNMIDHGRTSLTATTPDSIGGFVRGYSSLSTGTGRMPQLLKGYATFAETCMRKRTQAALLDSGIDLDDLRELVNDLWAMHDNCGGTQDE